MMTDRIPGCIIILFIGCFLHFNKIFGQMLDICSKSIDNGDVHEISLVCYLLIF